jgi:hypothetical protein
MHAEAEVEMMQAPVQAGAVQRYRIRVLEGFPLME